MKISPEVKKKMASCFVISNMVVNGVKSPNRRKTDDSTEIGFFRQLLKIAWMEQERFRDNRSQKEIDADNQKDSGNPKEHYLSS